MSPAVTVCIPAYNGAATISDALRSLVGQTMQDFEVLVVDDGSTDCTLEIVHRFADILPIRIVQNATNLGLAGNWNRSVELAEGRYVKFLFQDDLLHRRCLDRMTAVASDVDLVICARRALYENVTTERRRQYASYLRWASLRTIVGRSGPLEPSQTAQLILNHPFVNIFGEPVAHLFRTSALRDHPYDPSLIQLVDFDAASRVALCGRAYYLDRTLVTFRVHGDATTVRNLEDRWFELAVLDPLVLASRYLGHGDYANLRYADATTVDQLQKAAQDILARAHEALPAVPAEVRARFEVTINEPVLAAIGHPALKPDDAVPKRSLPRKLRGRADLALRRFSAALRRIGT